MAVRKYPGRDRVMAIDDARDVLWRQRVQGETARFPCLDPVEINAIGLPPMWERERKLPVVQKARCRKCENCLLHRRHLWTARAVDEILLSRRSWFGTLTVSPENRFRFRMEADLSAQRKRQEPLSDLPPADHFQYLAKPVLREATRFLKRLRKSGAVFRYLLVTEAHASGDPHLHILVHEIENPIGKRALEGAWRSGFSHWRLVKGDRSAATYVCKYLNKSAQTRVRASLGYGTQRRIAVAAEAVQTASRAADNA